MSAALFATLLALTAPAAAADTASVGFVLSEVHSATGSTIGDTLVTSLAPGCVRVSHRDGDAILDERRDRFVLLAPSDRTYRAMSLATWERRITEALAAAAASRRAAAGDSAAGGVPSEPLRFESEGEGGRVAGYACERFHLFTRREIFPGEVEDIELEIWVSRELGLGTAIDATYRRVIANLDRIELDATVERPPGVALRTQWRRRGAGRPPGSEESESSEVLVVERRPIAAAAFEIPAGYAPADSAQDAAPRQR